ncbi:VanZ family protein [Pyruvatibacter sp.]
MDRAAIFAGIAAAVVLALGLAPDSGPSADVDEYAHAGAFFVIAFLFSAAVPKYPWLGMSAAFAMGAFIELVQMAVPGRWGSVEDMTANLVGVIAGGCFFYAFARLIALYKSNDNAAL